MAMNPPPATNPHRIEAVDREPSSRPGVPMVPDQLVPVGNSELARQQATVPVLVSVDVGALTPVFSTAVPPRGISGLMRRRAYQIHEHEARRWLILLFADRVDVWESRVRARPWLFAGVLARLGATGFAITRAKTLGPRREWRRRWSRGS